MKPKATVILGVLVLGLASAFAMQSGHRSLAQRHLEARGGRAALQGLKVIERIGSFTFHGASPEVQGTYHSCIRYPDRVAVDIDAGPVQVHHVLGDFGALECDATFKTCTRAQEAVVEELTAGARTANREELDESIPENAAVEPILEGDSQVGYRYKKDDQVYEEEFSPDTGLLRRRKKGSRERRFADWRDVGGVLLPLRIEDYENGTKSFTVVLASAKHTDTPSEWCLQRFAAKAAEAKKPG